MNCCLYILWSFFIIIYFFILMRLQSSCPYGSKLVVDRAFFSHSKQESKGIGCWENAGNAPRGDGGRYAGRRKQSKEWREGEDNV